MINFIEHSLDGYGPRTNSNAMQADYTIALATDFKTAGEKLTERVAGDRYLSLNFGYLYDSEMNCELPFAIETIIYRLQNSHSKNINFAGNGIYTLGISQIECDRILLRLMTELNKLYPLESVRTGGQTGVDEASAKAADKLNIPTTVLAPKNWMFRDISGKDICNETLFKNRFL